LRQQPDDGGRGDLTDEQWQKLQPLLPPQKAWTGQPAAEHRSIGGWHPLVAPHGGHLGETFPNATAIIGQFLADSTAGERQESGNRFGQI
jgi:hypothetical protein